MAYAEVTSSIQDCNTAMRFWNSFVVPFVGIGDATGVQSYSGRGLGGGILMFILHTIATCYTSCAAKNRILV